MCDLREGLRVRWSNSWPGKRTNCLKLRRPLHQPPHPPLHPPLHRPLHQHQPLHRRRPVYTRAPAPTHYNDNIM